MSALIPAAIVTVMSSPLSSNPPSDFETIEWLAPVSPVVLEVGEVALTGPRQIGPLYWSGVVISPENEIVPIEVRPGTVAPAQEFEHRLQIANIDGITTNSATPTSFRFDAGCGGWAEIGLGTSPEGRDVRPLIESIELDGSDVNIELPPGWTSLGGGYLEYVGERDLVVSVGGKDVPVRLSQYLDTPPGVVAGSNSLPLSRVDDFAGLVLRGETTRPAVVVAAGDDTVALSGEVPVATLVELAESLAIETVEEVPAGQLPRYSADPGPGRCTVSLRTSQDATER